MQLNEFFDYKNRLVADMVTNPEIVSLLRDDAVENYDPSALVYTQIFPFEYVPETLEHGQTYICCDVDVQKTSSKTFLSPVIYVWVFTHKSKLRLDKGGVRVDKLCSEIAKTLNGSRYYGLGELDLYSVKRFSPITDYQGKVMMFVAKDFNRPSPTGKDIPSNRKVW